MNIPNPLFAGNIPIPFEMIIENTGLTLFEQEVKETLNALIDENGCKFEKAHIKLGSKVHLTDFYYTEKLFRNSYYAIRFAYLTSQYIFQKLKNNSGDITILGYGLYSELLVSNIARFLNELEESHSGRRPFNHSVIEDVEGLKLLNPHNIKEQVIIVIPIGTTLTTQVKILRKLQEVQRKIDIILNPICLLVVGHKKIKEIINSKGEITNEEVKKSWEKIDPDKREIHLANLSEGDNKKIEKTHYFIYLPSEWHLPHLCEYCWDKGKETPLFYTDKVSITPQTIFGFPEAKEIESSSFRISFQSNNSKDKAIISREMLKYNHFKRGTNHYLFYIDTNKFFDKNKEAIKEWLKKLRKNLQESHQGLLEEPCMLLAPTHETNMDFINLVNEQIFNDAAHVVDFNPSSEYRRNFKYYFQHALPDTSHVFFVDDALCMGKTLHQVQSFLQSLSDNIDITGCLVMINRMPWVTHQRVKKEVNNIYSFSQLEAPVMDIEKCYLCREKDRYEEVLQHTIVDALRSKIHNKLDEKLRAKNIDEVNLHDNDPKKARHLRRLELTHRLYHELREQFDVKEFINRISTGNRETKTNLVKTLSQPPFIYYKEVRKKIYPFLLKELADVLKSVRTKIEHIQYALILVKRLAYLGCPQILTSEFLEKIKVVKDNRKLHKNWPELKREIEKRRKDEKVKQLSFLETNIDSNIKKDIDIFCQKYGFEKPAWESLGKQNEKPEDIIDKFMENTTQFTLIYGLAVKEIIIADQSKAFRFEWELDKALKDSDLNDNKFYNLLKFLCLENNIILRGALKDLIDIHGLNEKDEEIITTTIKTNYKLSYLRYLINYHKFLEENRGGIPSKEQFEQISDKLDDQSFKTNFYQNTFIPLYVLRKSFKKEGEEKEESIDRNEGISQHINPLLEELLKIAHIDKQTGGAFLAIRKGYSLSSEVSDLYIVGKIGEKSEYIDDYLMDENSWTIKMFNGVKTNPDGNEWTNIEKYKDKDAPKYIPEVKFDELYEYQKLKATHFLFLRISGFKKKDSKKVLDPKGVIVFYKNKPFSPKEQRYLLLLRDELYEFLKKHYENYSFEDIVHTIRLDCAFYRLVHTIRKNIVIPIIKNFGDKEEVKGLITYLDESSQRLGTFLKLFSRKDCLISYKTDFLNHVDIIINDLKNTKHEAREINFTHLREFPPKVKISIPDIKISCYETLRTILSLILDNLIDNSFTHGKSEKVTVNLSTENNYIVLTVTDNGKGMSQEKPGIFDSETGLGIGTSIVKECAYMLKGKAKINNSTHHSKGVTVKLFIPYAI